MSGIAVSVRGTQAATTAVEPGLDVPPAPPVQAAPGMLQATLGTSQLLATPNDRRLHVLNPLGATLLRMQHQGLGASELAALLTDAFGLAPELARAQAQAHWQLWRSAGLLRAGTHEVPHAPPAPPDSAQWQLQQPNDPVWPAPNRRPLPPGAQRVLVVDRHIALHCTDTPLRQRLHAALGPAHAARMQAWSSSNTDHALTLHGTADAWHLSLDGATVTQGTTADAALVASLATLAELGCRPAERLLVVHGAGLVDPNGGGVLLVAPGGSGKTTLAAALDAQGFGLLSDDVVPVNTSGQLLGLGLPLCLKPGSWPVLQHCRSDVGSTPPVQRLGQTVRLLPACNPAPGLAVRAVCVLLTRYVPDATAHHQRLSPEQALQGLVQADAVLRDITQAKLDALAQWLNTVPAYSLHYPDLASGVQWVRTLAAVPAAAH